MAKRSEIDQVFVNLITNAVQAMEGGGSLKLTTEQAGDAIKVTIGDTWVWDSIAERGENLRSFFTTKDPGKGTGLGLSIVYQIVSNYGGTVDVDSAPGCGTTFIIHLPLR